MNDTELMNKRVIPALQEMYGNADNIFQNKHSNWPLEPSITWEQINNTIKYIKQTDDKYDAHFVLDCFFLDEAEQKRILKKATANLRHYWKWPYKSQILYTASQIKEMKNRLAELKENVGEESIEYIDLKEKIDNNNIYKKQDKLWKEYYKQLTELSEQLEKKEITKQQYNKKEEELAKSYGCTRRSRDAEAVHFEIWNYAPTISKENFNMYKDYWDDLSCIKTIKTKDNIENLVEELFYRKRGLETKNMTENEARNLSKIQNYMKSALLFIENYYKLYDEQTNR